MMYRRIPGRLFGAALVLLAAGCAGFEAQLAPTADLLPRWQRHDPSSRLTLDHGEYGAFLARYRSVGADGVARLAYARVTAADAAALDAYVRRLEGANVDGLSRPEQFAFWVNLYNAATIRLVLGHREVSSIRDIRLGGQFGPWSANLLRVQGEPLSLDDIEHRILRPIWRDPRIHYVVNCASIGCPDLPARPLTGATAEAMLEAAARAYVNHPRGFALRDGKLVASSLYRWFLQDFGGAESAVIAHARRYAGPELLKALRERRTIDAYEYDWALNAAR